MEEKPKIFISYSHRDEPYADKLLRHLKALSREADFDVWSDRKIESGEDWRGEIKQHIENAQVAILLVSADYLTSEWIAQEELPALLKEQSQRGLRILPLLVSPSLWKNTPLAYYQLLPRDGQALSSLSTPEQDRVLVELTEEVLASLRQHKEVLKAPKSTRPTKHLDDKVAQGVQKDKKEIVVEIEDSIQEEGDKSLRFFISHSKDDGDFAENLKFKFEKEGFFGWIDTDVLEAGMDWRQEIDDAILGSIAVILVLSPESKKSEYVTYEWAFALGSGLRIVPLMLKDTPIHPRLEIFQYLDFTNRRARPWSRLMSLLRELSNGKESPNQSLSADAKKSRG